MGVHSNPSKEKHLSVVVPSSPNYSRLGVEHYKVRSLDVFRVVRNTLGGEAGVVDVDNLERIRWIIIIK